MVLFHLVEDFLRSMIGVDLVRGFFEAALILMQIFERNFQQVVDRDVHYFLVE